MVFLLTEVILCYFNMHMYVVCTSPPWSQVIHTSFPWFPETGDDIGDHTCHQHIICMSSPLVPFDRGHHMLFPHACGCCLHIIFVAAYVVPMDRGHPLAVPIFPNVVPIDRSHLHIVDILYGLGLLLQLQYVSYMFQVV